MDRTSLTRLGVAAALLFAFSPLLIAAAQEHQPVPGAKETTARDLHSKLKSGADVMIIDVRTPAEYAQGHIPEAVNIPIKTTWCVSL